MPVNGSAVRIEDIVEPVHGLVNDQEHYDRALLMSHLCAYQTAGRLSQGKRLLEVGCGSGYGAFYLSHMAREVTAIDMDGPVITQARMLFPRPNLRYLCQNGVNLPFVDGSFERVGTFQVIEHIPEGQLPQFVRELSRVLTADGLCVISTLNVEHNRKGNPDYRKAGFHEKEFTAPELLALLQSVFPSVELFGLFPAARYRFYRRMKKWGLHRLGSDRHNPVKRFYSRGLSTTDHVFHRVITPAAIDLIAICRKS